jgi:hypothetical protein
MVVYEKLDGCRRQLEECSKMNNVTGVQLFDFFKYLAGDPPAGATPANPDNGELNYLTYAGPNSIRLGRVSAGNPGDLVYQKNITFNPAPAGTTAENEYSKAICKAMVELSKQPTYQSIYNNLIQPNFSDPSAPEADHEMKNSDRLVTFAQKAGIIEVPNTGANKGKFILKLSSIDARKKSELISYFVNWDNKAYVGLFDVNVMDHYKPGTLASPEFTIPANDKVEAKIHVADIDPAERVDTIDNDHVYVYLACRWQDKPGAADTPEAKENSIMAVLSSRFKADIPAGFDPTNVSHVNQLKSNIYTTFKQAYDETWAHTPKVKLDVVEPSALHQTRDVLVFPLGIGTSAQNADIQPTLELCLDVMAGGERPGGTYTNEDHNAPVFNKRLILRNGNYQAPFGGANVPAVQLSLLEGQLPANRDSVILTDKGNTDDKVGELEVDTLATKMGTEGWC